MSAPSVQKSDAWTLVTPIWITDGFSHTRNVYINSEIRLVAKLETSHIRISKGVRSLQLADEIAYKISKLFHWNTVPKTKIFHQFSHLDASKTRYIHLRNDLLKVASSKHPLTFTFQSFVAGNTLPNLGDPKTETPHLPSYQRAFLFDMILGKSDARGDNIIYNAETRELFEIDNEYIGSESYYGVLNDFPDLKKEPLTSEVLQEILSVDSEQLITIQKKYEQREIDLCEFWTKEPLSISYPGGEKYRAEAWDRIHSNFESIKKAIATLSERGETITLEKIELQVTNTRAEIKRIESEKRWAAKEAEELAEKENVEKERLAAFEKRRIDPPKPSGNAYADISDWIKMGHCVVLHYHGDNGHFYYQGPEKNVGKIRAIYMDINPSTHLLDEGEWPEYLEFGGCKKAPADMQNSASSESKKFRERYDFRYGY